MSAPKSVTKTVYKNGKCTIEFTDSCDASEYYIFELNRAALRDVGKFVCKKFNELFDAEFQKHTGKARKGTKYSVWSSKSTQYPRVEIGLKPDIQSYGPFEELGSSKTQKHGLLASAVKDNVAEIIKIESQYLSGLEKEAASLEAMIHEDDMNGDMDGED